MRQLCRGNLVWILGPGGIRSIRMQDKTTSRGLSIVFIAFVLMGNSTGEAAERTSCADQPKGAECWMELADQPGCYVWNGYLIPDQSVTWTGECSEDLARGTGTLKWTWNRGKKSSEETGHLRGGKQHGDWVARLANGTILEGPFVDGKRHGRWVIRNAKGKRRVTTFRNGERVDQ